MQASQRADEKWGECHYVTVVIARAELFPELHITEQTELGSNDSIKNAEPIVETSRRARKRESSNLGGAQTYVHYHITRNSARTYYSVGPLLQHPLILVLLRLSHLCTFLLSKKHISPEFYLYCEKKTLKKALFVV